MERRRSRQGGGCPTEGRRGGGHHPRRGGRGCRGGSVPGGCRGGCRGCRHSCVHLHARGQVQEEPRRRILNRSAGRTRQARRDPTPAAAARTHPALRPARHPPRRRDIIFGEDVAGVWLRRLRLQQARMLPMPHGSAGAERVQARGRAPLRRPVRARVPPHRGGVGRGPARVHQQDTAGG